MRWKHAYCPLGRAPTVKFIARWGGLLRKHRRSPPQRAIAGLCIVTMRRVANNLEFMGQQWPGMLSSVYPMAITKQSGACHARKKTRRKTEDPGSFVGFIDRRPCTAIARFCTPTGAIFGLAVAPMTNWTIRHCRCFKINKARAGRPGSCRRHRYRMLCAPRDLRIRVQPYPSRTRASPAR